MSNLSIPKIHFNFDDNNGKHLTITYETLLSNAYCQFQ